MKNKDIPMKILIADSNTLFKEKMKQLITDNYDFILTSEACSESEVLDEMSRHAFDVLILDLELSDGNGLDLLTKIMAIAPDVPVLVMSMFPVQQYEESVFREGAYGYVSKVNLSNELINALHQIFEGKSYFSYGCNSNPGEKLS
jgi:two-component system, NarL family, invasion response regulator UvrY